MPLAISLAQSIIIILSVCVPRDLSTVEWLQPYLVSIVTVAYGTLSWCYLLAMIWIILQLSKAIVSQPRVVQQLPARQECGYDRFMMWTRLILLSSLAVLLTGSVLVVSTYLQIGGGSCVNRVSLLLPRHLGEHLPEGIHAFVPPNFIFVFLTSVLTVFVANLHLDGRQLQSVEDIFTDHSDITLPRKLISINWDYLASGPQGRV